MIDQIGIALFGAAAIFLTQSKNPKTQRFACLVGLAGQPFWFYTTIHNEQWGALAATFLYTFAWCRGIWIHWTKK